MEIERTYVEHSQATGTFLTPSINTTLPNDTESIPMGSGITQGILGQGGMGLIYKIYNEKLDVFRALKLLHICAQLTETELVNFKNRFFREAIILSRLDHSCIAKVHTIDDWNNIPFIEMEFIDGIDLKNFISEKRTVPPVIALCIMSQVVSGLAHAHERDYIMEGRECHGIIHRDLKPANAMLDNTGRVKLLDFGIALPQGAQTLTMNSNFIGTLSYSAPEQLNENITNELTDIYSAGLILYELLTGRPAIPHVGNPREIMSAVSSGNFKKVKEFNLGLPKDIIYAVDKCLHQNPNKRIQSATDLQYILRESLDKYSRLEPDLILKNYMLTGNAAQKMSGIKRKSKKVHSKAVVQGLKIEKFFKTHKLHLIYGTILAAVLISFGLPRLWNKKVPPGRTIPDTKVTETITQKTVAERIVPEPPQPKAAPPTPPPKVTPPVKKVVKQTVSKPEKRIVRNPIQEFKKGRYASCLSLLNLSGSMNDISFLCYVGSLYNTGKESSAASMISSRVVDDGYYYYLVGKIAYLNNNKIQAVDSFKKALSTKSFTSQYRPDALKFNAMAWQYKFMQKPNVVNRELFNINVQAFLDECCVNKSDSLCTIMQKFVDMY